MLYFIPTPIGNLGDISQRSLKLLCESTIVFCEDTRVSKSLFSLLEKKYSIDFKQKTYISFHSHNEKKILLNLDLKIFENNCIFVSDAGMPCVSDPGASLINFCQENKLPYEVVPGANAALLAYAASGFEGSFCFFGFLPHKGKDRKNKFEKLISSPNISIIYESPHRIEKLLNELLENIPNRKIFLIKEATKKFQKYIFGTVCEVNIQLKDLNLKGEWVLTLDKCEENLTQGIVLIEDILSLEIPLKTKTKLLSKISQKSAKQWYDELINK